MAKPAFIYAFDNLGWERFVELCGELLGARYRDFQLGGVGRDGGVDGELHLHSETPEPAPFGQVSIQPGQVVLFQFKHIVVARAGGQREAREILKSSYLCDPTSK